MSADPYGKEEALSFVEAMRLALAGKVGFTWLVERLSDLAAYIESIATENERLNDYLDLKNAKDDYESYRASLHDAEIRVEPSSGE